ncbi:hypothetical protein Hjap01_02233 [Haloarcula japonica]
MQSIRLLMSSSVATNHTVVFYSRLNKTFAGQTSLLKPTYYE